MRKAKSKTKVARVKNPQTLTNSIATLDDFYAHCAPLIERTTWPYKDGIACILGRFPARFNEAARTACTNEVQGVFLKHRPNLDIGPCADHKEWVDNILKALHVPMPEYTPLLTAWPPPKTKEGCIDLQENIRVDVDVDKFRAALHRVHTSYQDYATAYPYQQWVDTTKIRFAQMLVQVEAAIEAGDLHLTGQGIDRRRFIEWSIGKGLNPPRQLLHSLDMLDLLAAKPDAVQEIKKPMELIEHDKAVRRFTKDTGYDPEDTEALNKTRKLFTGWKKDGTLPYEGGGRKMFVSLSALLMLIEEHK